MAFAIRPYHPSDFYSLYRICLLTGDNGNDGTALYRDPEIIGHYYAAPYAVLEPELAFVLTLDEVPCGYVIGTANSATFRERCEVEWFPPLRLRYPMPAEDDDSLDAMMARLILRGHTANDELNALYPAHMHIDLLPVAQGQRLGRKMMDTLLAQMRRLGVPGIHVGAGRKNPRAIRFYKSYGFDVLHESEGGVLYGMILR